MSYERLPHNELHHSNCGESIVSEGDLADSGKGPCSRTTSGPCQPMFKLIGSVSIALNVFILLILLLWMTSNTHIETSSFAGLTRTIPVTWLAYDPHHAPNETVEDELWKMFDTNAGVIALDDTYAERKNLPQAQRFPWDESKGIYILNAHHNLHCLNLIRHSLRQYSNGEPQTEIAGHVSHCIDALRQDIICNADDTPRWTGYAPRVSGVGQIHQCRDWSRLDAWAKAHTACYKQIALKGDDGLERYTFCPPGSSYLEKVRVFYPDTDSGHDVGERS